MVSKCLKKKTALLPVIRIIMYIVYEWMSVGTSRWNKGGLDVGIQHTKKKYNKSQGSEVIIFSFTF